MCYQNVLAQIFTYQGASRTRKRWKVMLCTDLARCRSQVHSGLPFDGTYDAVPLMPYRSTCGGCVVGRQASVCRSIVSAWTRLAASRLDTLPA